MKNMLSIKHGFLYIVREFLFVVLAVFAMLIISIHFEPLIISTTLSLNGSGQGGWPLPFSSSYWNDELGYQARQFNFGLFIGNVLIFYFLIRLVVAIMEGVHHRYDSQQYKELILRTVKRIAIMTIFLFLLYGVYALWVSIITDPQEVFSIPIQ